MNASRLLIAAALTATAFVAQAESPDASGQFAQRVSSTPVANVSAQPAKTRTQLQAEYIANRAAVAAMNGEDSGSAYLAAHRGNGTTSQVAGKPVNAQ